MTNFLQSLRWTTPVTSCRHYAPLPREAFNHVWAVAEVMRNKMYVNAEALLQDLDAEMQQQHKAAIEAHNKLGIPSDGKGSSMPTSAIYVELPGLQS